MSRGPLDLAGVLCFCQAGRGFRRPAVCNFGRTRNGMTSTGKSLRAWILGVGVCAFAAVSLFEFQTQDTPKRELGGEAHGVAVPNMDPSVKPGDDFFRYANGGWLARTEIPPDRSDVGVNTELEDLT